MEKDVSHGRQIDLTEYGHKYGRIQTIPTGVVQRRRTTAAIPIRIPEDHGALQLIQTR